MLRELVGDSIRRLAMKGAVVRGIHHRPPGQFLDRREGQRMKPRSVAGKLELVCGVAEDRMAEEVSGFGVHGDMLRTAQATGYFLLLLLLLILPLPSPGGAKYSFSTVQLPLSSSPLLFVLAPPLIN